MMKKFLAILSVFLLCVSAALSIELHRHENPPRQLTTQTQLLVVHGDTIERSLDLEDRFVFILTKDTIFYGSTGEGHFWQSSVADISAPGRFGAAHQRMLAERYAA